MTAESSLLSSEPLILAPYISDWELEGALPTAHLRRLSILRDLGAQVHAARSKSSSKLNPLDLNLPHLEARLENLRLSQELEGDLAELLRQPVQPNSPVQKTNSPSLKLAIQAIGPQKLSRPDRIFESSLVEACVQQNWVLWVLEQKVVLKEAEVWQDSMRKLIWGSRGVFLWTELSSEDQAFSKINNLPAICLKCLASFPPHSPPLIFPIKEAVWSVLFAPAP